MKKTLMLMLFLCLLCCTAHADVCVVCSGDSTCDTCEGNGYVFVQVYGTNMQVKAVCSAGCDNGVCPVCPAPCDVCGSDGKCNTCKGYGYVLKQVYGSNQRVKIVCEGEHCDNGGCTVCQRGAAAVPTAAPKPTATPKPTPKPTATPKPTKKPTPKPTTAPAIIFKDPEVKNQIQLNLKVRGLDWENPTPELLKSITWLSFHLTSSDVITTLDDLAYFPNLEEFKIDGSYGSVLKDFSAIAKLPKLKSLELTSLDLTDIEDLSGMAQLTHLSLIGNEITDISPLRNLTNLEELWLGVNQISDTSPLYSLMLNGCDIDLYGNPQTTVTAPTDSSSGYDATTSATSSYSSSSSSSRVISSPLAVFPTISKVKLAATKRDGDLTIYQYTYMEYQFLREYLDTITYEDLTLVAEGKDNSGATHFYYRHNASGGEVEIVIDTYGKSESKFSVYAYDGITLSDYH